MKALSPPPPSPSPFLPLSRSPSTQSAAFARGTSPVRCRFSSGSVTDSLVGAGQEIATVKNDAERDLALAKPALDAALAALNSITPKDIVGLKALKNPPDVVKRIFDCVLLLRYLRNICLY